MKVGIVGVGFVGTSCAKAMLLRGSCSEIVLIDLPARERHTRGVRNDLSHGAPFCSPSRLTVGSYADLADASAVVVTAGINEKRGQAIDRKDPWGRQRLLPDNAAIYREVIPGILSSSCGAPIIVVTDPPDTLADVALEVVRRAKAPNSVLSAGTVLDSLRFRVQIAERVGCAPQSVEALVIGEHGKTQVYCWSSARAGGEDPGELVPAGYENLAAFRRDVEAGVLDANIDIIEATDASQHGIGIVTARIVEAILGDHRVVLPVGSWSEEYGVTLSLPSILGTGGVQRVLPRPGTSTGDRAREETALRRSAAYLGEALQRLRDGAGFDRPPSWTWEEWHSRFTKT